MVLYIDEVTPFYNSIALLSDAFRRIAGIKTPEEKIKEMQLELLKQQGKMGEYELKLAEQKIKRGEAEEERMKEWFKLATQRAAQEIEAMKLTNKLTKEKFELEKQKDEKIMKKIDIEIEQIMNSMAFNKMIQDLLKKAEQLKVAKGIEELKIMRLQRKGLVKSQAMKEGIKKMLYAQISEKIRDKYGYGKMQQQAIDEFKEKIKPYAYNISPDVMEAYTFKVRNDLGLALNSLLDDKIGEASKYYTDIRTTGFSILEAVRKSVSDDVDVSRNAAKGIISVDGKYDVALVNINQIISSMDLVGNQVIPEVTEFNIKSHIDNVKKIIEDEGSRFSSYFMSFFDYLGNKYGYSDIFMQKVHPYLKEYVKEAVAPLEKKIIGGLVSLSSELPNKIKLLSTANKEGKEKLAAVIADLKIKKEQISKDIEQLRMNIFPITKLMEESFNPLKSFIDFYLEHVVEEASNKYQNEPASK